MTASHGREFARELYVAPPESALARIDVAEDGSVVPIWRHLALTPPYVRLWFEARLADEGISSALLTELDTVLLAASGPLADTAASIQRLFAEYGYDPGG